MKRFVVAGMAVVTSVLMLVVALAAGFPSAQQAKSVDWVIDNLATVGSHKVSVVGSPRVVHTPVGGAVEFNGRADGLFVDAHPIEGLATFTVEALIEPAADGPAEQRFLHLSETGSENRLMMETRLLPDRSWCLDTFLRHGEASLTLIDRQLTHPAGGWHAVALMFDGKTMAHYVDGVRELAGNVAFKTLGAGRASIGVRQNLVSWFKGRVRLIRFTPEALPVARLMTVPQTHVGK
jgi:hypothetical protein